jgi:uncharacterized membrane protein YbhN (UPF0104 family)
LIKIFKSKLFLHFIGYIITAICFYFIYLTVRKTDLSVFNIVKSERQFFSFLLLIILISISSLISAYSWKLTLEFVSNKNVSIKDVFTVYVKTNIAKYLPGNVLHYVGRNLIGQRMGWTHSQVALSTVLELLFIIILPPAWIMVFYFIGIINLPTIFSFNFFPEVIVLIFLSIMLTFTFIYGILHFFLPSKLAKLKLLISQYIVFFISPKFLKLFLTIAILILTSFLLSGYLFYLTGKWLVNVDLGISKMLEITSALAIASYSSILTPGVPGGIGIKEAISVYLIGLYGYNSSIFMVILLMHRVITIISEILLFGVSFLFSGSLKKKNSSKQMIIEM